MSNSFTYLGTTYTLWFVIFKLVNIKIHNYLWQQSKSYGLEPLISLWNTLWLNEKKLIAIIFEFCWQTENSCPFFFFFFEEGLPISRWNVLATRHTCVEACMLLESIYNFQLRVGILNENWFSSKFYLWKNLLRVSELVNKTK